MTTHFTAIYQNGVLRPTAPLQLREGQTVQVSLETPPTSLESEDEVLRRIHSAKNLEEVFAAMNEAPEDDEYDLLEALNENRRQAGASRLLFPPEEKGVTW